MQFIIIILIIMLIAKWLKNREEYRKGNIENQDNKSKEAVMWNRKIGYAEGLFRDHYLDVKTFYMLRFHKIPCISFISEIDSTKAFHFISEEWKNQIITVYQHSWFDHEHQKLFSNTTVFVLKGDRLIEVGSNYCQVLNRPDQYDWKIQMINALAAFRNEADVKENRIIGFTCKAAMN